MKVFTSRTNVTRLTLCALLLGPSIALACSPIPSPPEVTQAYQKLAALTLEGDAPCPVPTPARTWQSCSVFQEPAEQIAALLGVAYGGKVARSGPDWTVVNAAQGITVTVHPEQKSVQVTYRRLIPATERLHQDLQAALTARKDAYDRDWLRRLLTLFRSPTCADLGVRDTGFYRLSDCRVVPRRSGPHSTLNALPHIELTLAWAADKSVRTGTPLRFGYTGDTCQMYEFF